MIIIKNYFFIFSVNALKDVEGTRANEAEAV